MPPKADDLQVTHWLFSYGTLQLPRVQMETFGRLLTQHQDAISGFALDMIEITDPHVLATSSKQFHPILRASGDSADTIQGMVMEITDQELQHADQYEVDDYQRVLVTTQAGREAWLYIAKTEPTTDV